MATNPRDRAIAALEQAREAIDEMNNTMATAMELTGNALAELLTRAVLATGRPPYYPPPQLHLGHLSRERFDAVCDVLGATPEVSHNSHDGNWYRFAEVERFGIEFRVQTFEPPPASDELANAEQPGAAL